MVEAGGRYPRWRGGAPLRSGPGWHVIALQEIRKASRETVFLFGAAVALALGVNSIVNLIGDEFHTTSQFLFAIQAALWGGVAISASLAGPSLVDDVRSGALELYLTRAISKTEYLAGKIGAVFALAAGTVFVVGMIYFLTTLIIFNDHPDNWFLVPLGIIAIAIVWGLLVAGVGAAIASLARQSRVALLVFVGLFLAFGLIMPWLLEWVTESDKVWIMSPMMAMLAQSEWLFQYTSEDVGFPYWWGLIEVVLLIVVGWAIFLMRKPMVRGEEA